MTRKPGVLLVTTSPLLPLNAGGRIYTWGTTEPLAEEFDYHLICLATPEEMAEFDVDRETLTQRYQQVFKSFRLFARPPIPGHMDRTEAARHLLFHTRHGLPLMDVSYYSNDVVAEARRLVSQGIIDVIEVDHAHMAYVRRFDASVPAVLVNHNIEGDLHPFWMTDRWNLPELVIWRLFASISRRNTRRVEIDNAYGFSSKLFISASDAAQVSDACPKLIMPVPMEVGPSHDFGPTGHLELLWLGSFSWPPNLEGLDWFLENVWPDLAADATNSYRLHIVGGNPPPNLADRHDDDSVIVHGYVDDIAPIKANADVLIAPLLAGSGVRVKVVEALAAGIPVVATPKGAEGLSAEPDRDYMLAPTAREFVSAIGDLARSPGLRQRLSRAGQEYVRSTHQPEHVAAIKARALRDAIRSAEEPVG